MHFSILLAWPYGESPVSIESGHLLGVEIRCGLWQWSQRFWVLAVCRNPLLVLWCGCSCPSDPEEQISFGRIGDDLHVCVCVFSLFDREALNSNASLPNLSSETPCQLAVEVGLLQWRQMVGAPSPSWLGDVCSPHQPSGVGREDDSLVQHSWRSQP